eukprot:TRINITY_DN7881_c0_g1_i1.p1 TRINITY_DN7881_c0_g1~~TRINITY_DN7881_c0_g1_i1.p1  ORF type:complete len:552 (-),score=125.60 TRINITY_DN7881_c0_g1_i1:52-1707(-)
MAGRVGRRVFVIGVGMTKFEKPGKRDWDYPDMAKEAVTKALKDAGVRYEEVQQACVGYVYGDSTCGQRALYSLGETGIPIYNVNNNCSTGSTALYMAKQFIEGGVADCVLALGFEKMERGSLTNKWNDRTNPMDRHFTTMFNTPAGQDLSGPPAAQMFGSAGREHMAKYGTTLDKFAKIAHKNHKHSVNNPYSQFRDEYSLEQIQKAPEVCSPMTKLQCCPTSEGAAAAILASEEFVKKHGLEHQAVEILAMSMATDLPTSFQDSCIKMIGFDMTRKAASEVYNKAKVSPNDVQVIELHDCFSANELVTYEALQLCSEGKAGDLIESGAVTYGGKWVVNPSGGLISKGHPLGATGLAQCSELCWQLRGMCGNRQVPNARVALQHNLGLGGAAVVALYKLGFLDKPKEYPKTRPNPAVDPNAFFETANGPSPVGASGESFASDSIFAEIKQRIGENPALVKSIGGVYRFNVVKGGETKTWLIDLKNGAGAVSNDKDSKADLTITVSDDDLLLMSQGKLNGQQAFMQKKIKVQGNMGLAMKLDAVIKQQKASL